MTIPKKNRSAMSLRATLTIAFPASGIITPILSGGVLLISQVRMQRAVISGSRNLIAQQTADKVAGYIDSRFRTLDTALWLTEVKKGIPRIDETASRTIYFSVSGINANVWSPCISAPK